MKKLKVNNKNFEYHLYLEIVYLYMSVCLLSIPEYNLLFLMTMDVIFYKLPYLLCFCVFFIE